MEADVLEVRGLTKRYGRRVVVNALSFSVKRGGIYGFLGRNGAGKSTTMRMILGLVRPSGGEIYVNGQAVHAARHPANWPVGAIVESPMFYDYLSARTNLEMLASLSGGASRERIDQVVEMVGLSPRQHERVSVYSHGMRQRLGLAQALLPDPQLVMLDEPLDGLDPNGIRAMRDLMLSLVRDHGVTVFMSSHNLSEVETTCSHVVLINLGVKVYEGPTADLIAGSRRVRFRAIDAERAKGKLGELAGAGLVENFEETPQGISISIDHARVPELNRELVAAGVDVLELTPVRHNLEDVFIGLTAGAAHAPEAN